MKPLLILVFVAAELAGIYTGFDVGQSDAKDNIETTILNGMTLDHPTPEGPYFLRYICKDQPLASMNVDTDEVTFSRFGELSVPDDSYIRKSYNYVVAIALGGGAVGFGKPLMQAFGTTKAERNEYIVTAAAGAASGFSLGYLIGSKNMPACDSPIALGVLNTKENWVKLKRDALIRAASSALTVMRAQKHRDPAVVLPIYDAITKISQGKGNSGVLNSIAYSQEELIIYNDNNKTWSERYLTFDNFMSAAIGLISVAIAAAFVSIMYSEIWNKKKAKRSVGPGSA